MRRRTDVAPGPEAGCEKCACTVPGRAFAATGLRAVGFAWGMLLTNPQAELASLMPGSR